MRKVNWVLLAVAGMLAVLNAQEEQRTTVVKSTSSNPTIGIQEFNGPEEMR